ncbi:MAG: hypothetical protein JNM02_07795 [Anaerolineales bacterium]|nr:hypothetical protein [Anaerolineales bacterium]
MSRFNFRGHFFQLFFALLAGLGLGLVYSWFLSPVTYVDATPAILRSDFKDQYRVVIAASYASTQNLDRARVRLQLLGDVDPVGELSAQAQRMLAAGESFEKARPLAQLATDLNQGFASLPSPTPFTILTPQDVSAISATETQTEETVIIEETVTPFPTILFEQTPITPVVIETATPRATFTPIPGPGAPFALVGRDTVCAPGTQAGLLQFMLMDSRRKQVAGIEIIVTWSRGEDRFFTGFKPELGNGYADFIMEKDTVYSVRIAAGGAFVSDIVAPACTDPNGVSYPGGLLLTFQQP